MTSALCVKPHRTPGTDLLRSQTSRRPGTWASEGVGGRRLDFEIWYLPINFLVAKCFSLRFELVKCNLITVRPPGKNLLAHHGNMDSLPPWKKSFRRPGLGSDKAATQSRTRKQPFENQFVSIHYFTVTRTYETCKKLDRHNTTSQFRRKKSKKDQTERSLKLLLYTMCNANRKNEERSSAILAQTSTIITPWITYSNEQLFSKRNT